MDWLKNFKIDDSEYFKEQAAYQSRLNLPRTSTVDSSLLNLPRTSTVDSSLVMETAAANENRNKIIFTIAGLAGVIVLYHIMNR